MTEEKAGPAGEAGQIVETLNLLPHPEGGWYRETFRAPAAKGTRGAVTQIYYLLAAGEESAWHRVTDATEIWHHYQGAPLLLSLSPDGKRREEVRLGGDLRAGETSHAVVPPGCWQAARSLGGWSLMGCSVAPAFDFSGFEMAPPGWEPNAG